jgi:hypothetical protein
MSQFLLYILGTIGTAVVTTIVGQVTTRFVAIGGAPKSSSRPAASNTSPLGGAYIAATPVPASPDRRPPVNIGAVIVQAGIFQLILNLIALVFFTVVGAVLLASGATSSATTITAELLWAIMGTILLVVAFYFIGVRVERAVRWRHLMYLAVGTTILTVLVNTVFMQRAPTIFGVLGSAFQAFLAMGIGGAFAARAKGRTQPQTPVASPTVPYGYGYGAPGSMPFYPQSAPPYPPAAPGGTPPYPQPHVGWSQNPNPAAPSVYPSAWPYSPAHSGGQTPGSMPPTPPTQQPPATQAPGEGAQ